MGTVRPRPSHGIHGIGLAFLASRAAPLAAMHDVIVIGAGVAGLAAATDLAAAGADVCVLEAQSRAGGRVRTSRDAWTPLPVELGAEFLHGDAERTRALTGEARLAAVDVTGAHWSRGGASLEPVPDVAATLEDAQTARGRHAPR